MRDRKARITRRALLPAVALGLMLLLAACGRNMAEQPSIRAYEASPILDGQAAMFVPPENTVSREFGNLDQGFLTGFNPDGSMLGDLPIELTAEVMQRGQERYDIFCAVCHNYDGSGLGVMVQRGFPQPTSLSAEHLRGVPIGYFFNVMTNGFGRMYPYDSRVPAADRWAIAAYIRALQLSQGADPADLPEDISLEQLLDTVQSDSGGQN